ncbi:MAG TPA: polysaccharide deacetylase family protein [Steroidobacter sp.]
MIEFFRKRSRRLIASALYYTGILWLLAAIRFRRRAVVLMYHRVLPESEDTFSADGIIVRPETFARQMAFLRRHFKLLSVEDLERCFAEGKPLPSRSCLVTFDDGWADNYEYALPILREQNVPAVIFLATDYIGTDACFWQERVTRSLYNAVQAGGAAGALAERYVGPDIRSKSPAEQRFLVRQAVDKLKHRPAEEIQQLERELKAALASSPGASSRGADRFMTWSQVSELARSSRVTLGAHGCSHTPLTSLDQAQVSCELEESRSRIAQAVGRPITCIAYPNGNFDDKVLELTRRAGYALGFTTDKGSVGVEDHPLALRRINIHEGATRTMPEFLCSILLVFQRFRRATVY